jgi:hypothetical protein
MSTWILEIVEPFTVQQGGHVTAWAPGQRMALSPEKAQRVIDRVGRKVRVVGPDLIDAMIGTVVEAPLEFLRIVNEGEDNETTQRVIGVGPWIVHDVVGVESGVLTGRWLWLVHGPDQRWTHESKTGPYHCPKCRVARCWSSKYTVICAGCIPPTCPEWRALWREVAELSVGLTPEDPRYAPFVDEVNGCDEAFRHGDYAGFQRGVIRARRVWQESTTLRSQ